MAALYNPRKGTGGARLKQRNKISKTKVQADLGLLVLSSEADVPKTEGRMSAGRLPSRRQMLGDSNIHR